MITPRDICFFEGIYWGVWANWHSLRLTSNSGENVLDIHDPKEFTHETRFVNSRFLVVVIGVNGLKTLSMRVYEISTKKWIHERAIETYDFAILGIHPTQAIIAYRGKTGIELWNLETNEIEKLGLAEQEIDVVEFVDGKLLGCAFESLGFISENKYEELISFYTDDTHVSEVLALHFVDEDTLFGAITRQVIQINIEEKTFRNIYRAKEEVSRFRHSWDRKYLVLVHQQECSLMNLLTHNVITLNCSDIDLSQYRYGEIALLGEGIQVIKIDDLELLFQTLKKLE